MDNVRYNISPCSQEEMHKFISKIDGSVYTLRNIVIADERSRSEERRVGKECL